MRKIFTLMVMALVIYSNGQSKKELRSELISVRSSIQTYEELNNQLREKNEKLHLKNENLEKQLENIVNDFGRLLPNLIVSEGFPEKFYPERENIGLYDDVYSLRQDYRRADTSIYSDYNTKYYTASHKGSPDTVLLLGIIDSTLYMNYANVVYGTVPVLYKGKIRYTTFFDLKGSEGYQNAKEAFRKKELIDEFGREIGEKIYRGVPWVGMTYFELRAMYGNFDSKSSYQDSDTTVYTYVVKDGYRTFVFSVINNAVVSISNN